MNNYNLTNDELHSIREWQAFNDKVIQFTNKANINLFKEIYGDDGSRLIEHFVNSCNRDFIKFETYLTWEQKNLTFTHIVKIKP